jgi:hypothetical protein
MPGTESPRATAFVGAACRLGFAAALCVGCGPAPLPGPPAAAPPPAAEAPAASNAPSAPPEKEFDPCEGSPPVPREYLGILRTARCEQDMYLKMADVVTYLGVECNYCHIPHPTEPKKFLFPVMTPRKEVANWMSMHLMPSLKRADGKPMTCGSCHIDHDGKPVAKILGDPRDPSKAQEWMSMVMVNKFVSAKGEKLKCKSCHGANYATPNWKSKVILKTEQLPPH